jgi:N-acetylated-alpha-linked acidic dipeptidase
MSKFGDPTFVYHVTAAQLWGTIALRLAEAPLLPYDYSDYAAQISDFMNENLRVAKRRNLADGLEEKAATDAIAEFAREAARVEKLRQDLLGKLEQKSSSEKTSAASLRRINDSLILAERALTDQRGLRGRPWYKHQIYAPGYYTGYAALPLPDLRQALDDRNSASAKDGLNRIVQAINRATETLKQAR